MEKDIDEVGKIAHGVKAKIEAINRDVLSYWLNIVFMRCQFIVNFQTLFHQGLFCAEPIQ